jgi:hypothetical protein
MSFRSIYKSEPWLYWSWARGQVLIVMTNPAENVCFVLAEIYTVCNNIIFLHTIYKGSQQITHLQQDNIYSHIFFIIHSLCFFRMD